MQAAVGLVIGVLIAFGILFLAKPLSKPREEGSWGPAWAVWVPPVLGAVATAMIVAGLMAGGGETPAGTVGRLVSLPWSITLGFAALIAAVGQLVRGDRRWQVWLGTVLGALPAAFWIWFLVGELLFPH